MLAHHRLPVCLSFLSVDLPIWSNLETAATLYQKDTERFHLLLTEEIPPHEGEETALELPNQANSGKNRLIWLELSPYRVIMTMQGNGTVGYRHFWEKGIYGMSRYWLQENGLQEQNCLRLRNFTYNLQLKGRSLPESLRVEYELWSETLHLGSYVLHLELHH
jgi:hypothetical protein